MLNTKDHVAYDTIRDRYLAYHNGKSYAFSVARYGGYAKKLAEIAMKTGVRYQDYFEDDGAGTTIFFINTHVYGEMKVFVDTEDAFKFFDRKISVEKDQHAHTYYASTKDGAVHRIIMQPKSSKDLVDHINRNGLDNRKSNLRIVDTSINNRNASVRKDNKTGLKGVIEDEQRYRLYWYDENQKKHSKSFSKAKYGKEEALEKIKEFREQIYTRYDYIA